MIAVHATRFIDPSSILTLYFNEPWNIPWLTYFYSVNSCESPNSPMPRLSGRAFLFQAKHRYTSLEVIYNLADYSTRQAIAKDSYPTIGQPITPSRTLPLLSLPLICPHIWGSGAVADK